MKPVQLFESENLRLTPIDVDRDAQGIASWTYELDTAAKMREDQPVRPMAVFEVKKLYEKWTKESDENSRQYLFAIRKREPNNTDGAEQEPIIGVLRIMYIQWVHGAAYIDLIFGSHQDWERYAREVLDMGLRYAFDELGLFRVTAVIAEHNNHAHSLFEQANFTLEIRQRQSVYWNRRSWDKLYFGLLRPEWKMQRLAEVNA